MDERRPSTSQRRRNSKNVVPNFGSRRPYHPGKRERGGSATRNRLGIGTASILHAQTKPPAYTFVEIDVKDQDGYTKDFLPKAQANIKEMGGKYLAGGFNKAISFSGSPPPNRVVLLQFPDIDALKAFFVKEKQLRQMSATNTPASAGSGSRTSTRSDNDSLALRGANLSRMQSYANPSRLKLIGITGYFAPKTPPFPALWSKIEIQTRRILISAHRASCGCGPSSASSISGLER
jgi:uncharacterized protein (DUF1330 family)